MTVYASVIAVTKDLGDIEGDRQGGIQVRVAVGGYRRLEPTAVAAPADDAPLSRSHAAPVSSLVPTPFMQRSRAALCAHPSSLLALAGTLILTADVRVSLRPESRLHRGHRRTAPQLCGCDPDRPPRRAWDLPALGDGRRTRTGSSLARGNGA
mmetsp:Transcript_21366/g.52466  ORF Transcript_21366/g.52466 Transcript_21366/m.52466 type:complete len:153 (+) Transcript_21366:922-1380(+)